MLDLQEIFERSKQNHHISKDDRVLIIDSTNSWIRVVSSIAVINDNGLYVGGIIGMLRSIASNIRDFGASRCILVFDGSGGSQRRRKIYPEYKAQRTGKFKARQVEGFELTEQEETESMKWQLQRTLMYFECLPIQIIIADQIEADDVISHICTSYFENKNSKIRIVSTDRDFLQLVSDNIEVYSPVKKKLYQLNDIQQELDILPENYLIYRVLTGDLSDNIPGVPGLGLKTLIKNLPEIQTKVLTLEDIFVFCEERIKNDKKVKQIFKSIIEFREQIELNYKLMQLHDVDISGNSKLKISDQLNKEIQFIDKPTFKKLLIEDCLNTTFKNPDEWVYNSFNRLNAWAKR
jgi:DNA polymerase-1